jgi:transaldolase
MSDVLKTNLNKLYELGVEPWYDNISRQIINDGSLKDLVDSGIKGVTSNPAIIANSIKSGDNYNQQINEITSASSSVSPEEIYWKCITEDIKSACGILNPNFVSLEVSPELFDNEKATITQAVELSEKVGADNLMVKIPATPECYPAITSCLNEGLNINVTLMFSHDELKRTMEAVSNANSQQNVVFSFFVSRLDAAANQFLPEDLKFKLAISYALEAHRIWEANKIENTKMLWASTSMKDTSKDPLYYVRNLITSESVNTMPTVVFDHLSQNEVNFSDQLIDFPSHDEFNKHLDLNEILGDLKQNGLVAFIDSFKDGLKEIGTKING